MRLEKENRMYIYSFKLQEYMEQFRTDLGIIVLLLASTKFNAVLI